jgi:hypothetical protein
VEGSFDTWLCRNRARRPKLEHFDAALILIFVKGAVRISVVAMRK